MPRVSVPRYNGGMDTERRRTSRCGRSRGDWDEFRRIDEIAFGYTWQGDELAADKATLEMDRSLVAYLDGVAAGIASAYSLRLAVPGGRYIPAAGVTWVGVLPTHRRRGVARALMRRQLDDIAAAGREPVAVLWSSEPTIYGRFGYGVAAHRAALELPGDASLLPPVEGEAGLRARITTPAEARAAVDAVDARHRAAAARPPGHDDRRPLGVPHRRPRAPPRRRLRAAGPGGRARRRGPRVRALRGQAGVGAPAGRPGRSGSASSPRSTRHPGPRCGACCSATT